MDIDIDLSRAEPVYEQIVRQIQQGVQQGHVRPGQPLPSIRQLAHDLDLNPNTVAKAYKLLEAERVIRTAGQKGTFINDDAATHIARHATRDATYLLGNLAKSLCERGLSLAQVQEAFNTAMQELISKEPFSKEPISKELANPTGPKP